MNPIAERCAPFDDDLSALLDGQLDATRAAAVRAHAESCRDCAQRLAALRGVDAALRSVAAAPLDATRSARMRTALAASLRDEANGAAPGASPLHRTPPRRRRWLAPVGFAAAAAAAATLFLVMRTQPPVAPPAERVVIAAAERVAPKLRADAEAAARELTAHRDAPLGASAPPSDDAAVTPSDAGVIARDLDERFAAACNAGDVAAVTALYADDATAIFPMEGGVAHGKAEIGKLVALACHPPSVRQLEQVAARFLTASHISVIGQWKQTHPGPDGQPVVMAVRTSEILVRTAAGWRFLVDHASVGAPPPAKL